jgi:hypothetical protein
MKSVPLQSKRADLESGVWSNSYTRVLSRPTSRGQKKGGRIMSSLTRAACFGAIAGSALFAGLGQTLASEPANLGNFLPGNTMGATIAAAPPPGLFFASTAFYIPMVSGNGNAGCGPGCKERYNAVGATVNLT